MHLLTESSLLNPISTCFRNSAYCANVNNCGCSEHHITPDPVFPCIARRPTSKLHLENNDTKHDSLFSFFFFDSNFHLQNTSEDQLMHTAPGHNLVPWIFLTVNKNKKKNNSDLQVSSWKVFYQNHMLFVFVFLSYMNNQQSVPKFNSSVWPGPTEKTVSLFCSTSIRLWDKDQLVRANVQP